MSERKAKEKKKMMSSTMGGPPFFLSLFSLIVIALCNITFLVPTFQSDPAGVSPSTDYSGSLLRLGLAAIVGWFTADLFIRGATSVAIHELKHYILSQMVGNKYDGMKVTDADGHVEYRYSPRTAKFNAIIALAPYFLPLVTFPALLVAYAVAREDHFTMVLIVGFGIGFDLLLNTKDISPHQSDLYRITGGYRVALAFIVAMNATILSFLVAWALGEHGGIVGLIMKEWEFFVMVVGRVIEG